MKANSTLIHRNPDRDIAIGVGPVAEFAFAIPPPGPDRPVIPVKYKIWNMKSQVI